MTRAKPIDCPIELDGCGALCLEIRTHGYPKGIYEPNVTKVYREYRFVCPKCGKEWIYYTNFRMVEEVQDAEFHFGKDGKVIPC
jgi:hypothetical protein